MFKKASALCTTLILFLTIAVVATGCTQQVTDEAGAEEDYVAVETEAAVLDNLTNGVRLRGKIVTDEEVSIVPKATGTVENIEVKLGDQVVKDTVLFRIDQKDMQYSLDQAESAVNLANRSVDQANNSLKTAQLNYEMAERQYEIAQANLERTRILYEEGAISAVQLEQEELAASQNPLEIARTQVNQGEVGLQLALDQQKQAQITYDQARSNYNNTAVKAPIDGVVTALNVKVGQIAASGQVAAVVVDTNRVYIQLNVVENMVNDLQVGQEAFVTVTSAGERVFTSVIDYISPTADVRTQLYPVKIYVDNSEAILRPGMNGEVRLTTQMAENAIIIKRGAVIEQDDANLVYVVENDQVVERNVVLGLDTGDYVEIKEGIEAGDQVIIAGQHYVEQGQKVKVVKGEQE